MQRVEWLPPRTWSLIEAASEAVTQAFGDDLVAVLLVGAAVHPERHDRARFPELLVVVQQSTVAELRDLARLARASMRRGVRLRVVTQEELERSADVFTVEVADWMDVHLRLRGDDPFAAVRYSDAELCRSVEQGLRGLGRRVRNRVLAGLATDGQRDDPQAAVAQALERLLVLGRYVLGLLGEEPVAEEGARLTRLGEVANKKAEPLVAALAELRRGAVVPDPLGTIEALIPLLDALTAKVDALEVAA